MLRLAIAILLSLITSPVALAQAPLSAIEWLNDSIKNPPPFEIVPDAEAILIPENQSIAVLRGLAPVSPDAIGLLSPSVTGFPANLWGDMHAAETANLLSSHPVEGTPEAKSMFWRILLAQANPAPDDVQDGLVLQARTERLVEMGALDAAEALIALAPTSNPSIFKRKFDISILTDRTTAVCETMKETPAITDDLSARVYCLARSGDWNAAAITLSLGAGIGAIEPAREEMLIRFLDPVLFEDHPDPVAPTPMSAMDFVLREAVLLPRPSGLMSLPYIYRDIGPRAPLRAKMKASERLVIAGSLSENLLFSAYREGKAASSGGVWGRANSIQTLDAALIDGSPESIAEALITAYEDLANVGLLLAMANEYADILLELDYSPALAPAKHEILDLMHLGNVSSVTWSENAILTQQRQLALAIVTHAPLVLDPSSDAILQAIVNGLSGPAPDSPSAHQLLSMLEIDQYGQAMLAALHLLENGALADPTGIRTGLYVLSAAGQAAAARRIAVQILLLPSGG